MQQHIKEAFLQKFQSSIPESLYWDFQELATNLGSTPNQWETFLDDPEIKKLIESKLNKYLQIEARKALRKLSTTQLTSQEVTAIRQILENSDLLKQKAETKQHIIVTPLTSFSSSSNKEVTQ